jgi:hypothetical protein
MIGRIREFINKSSWLGWALAVVLLGLSVFMFFRGQHSSDPYSPERMTETVIIKFTDTGDEVEMTRGQLDKEMRRRGDKLDPTKGVINPKTGLATGFPFDKNDWEEMIARINAEKEEVRTSTGKSIAPAPRETQPISPDAAKILEGGTSPEKK